MRHLSAGPVLLRAGLVAVLTLCVATARAEGGWSSLWRTADQRGEALLRAGDAAAAADAYTDPRRKAYAQLKAGDHRAAAESYATLHEGEAPYNRGNALVRLGALRQALQAYDEALHHNPDDRDARRNRELVAKELQEQQRISSRQGQAPSTTPGGNAAPPAAQPPTPAASGSRGPEQAGATPQPGAGREPPAPGAQGPANRPPSSGVGAAQGLDAPNGPGNARNEPDVPDDLAQAERDVTGGGGSRSGLRDPRETAPELRSEKQLAEDQWLRRLPDDPAGLLRRKFLIQHLKRQGSGE